MRAISFLLAILCLPLSSGSAAETSLPLTLASPNGQLQVTFNLGDKGQPTFSVNSGNLPVAGGTLGLDFAEGGLLSDQFKVVDAQRTTRDETYAIPVGKAASARNHHQELAVTLEETQAARRRLGLEFRAFDDGVAFRYVIPKQESMSKFVLTDERTQLSFPGDPQAKYLPLKNFTTPYEWYYQTKPVSQLDPKQLIGLPILMQHPKQVWLAVTEANLTDYAGMYLSRSENAPGTLVTKLSPLPGRGDGAKVVGTAPHPSPWRIIMVADDPGRLLESNIVFHLSDPPAIKDTAWIRPGQTTFPWWNHYVLKGVDFKPGVNTATMKHYIDFCAEQGIPYHSLDGLDIAWYGGPIHPNGPTDITKAAPSINMPELLAYAKAKGVRLRLWMHWKALQPQIDEAFRTYEEWGIEGVMVDFMDRDDQEMVHFYHEMASKAAKHHLTLTLHGAYKPTGMERTWPNVLTYEAALNQEYNKWQPEGVHGTPPAHNLDIAFVRMLAGPLDYHQGGMRNVLPENYRFSDVAPPVQGTRGHQLGMYVVYQNHLPMLADYPSAYRGQPDLKFLTQIPATWDATKVLQAELGSSLVIARRKGDAWYLGGMTAAGRKLDLPLSFLPPGRYEGEIWEDDESAGPTAVKRRLIPVAPGDKLSVTMPPSGGFAAVIKPATK